MLYSFGSTAGDGSEPVGRVIFDKSFDKSGALYGTTYGGFGTEFKLTPPVPPATKWTETVLHRFKGGSDGSVPIDGLIHDSNGLLYGTTQVGGTRDNGTVFKLTPPVPPATRWIKTVLYSFQDGPDGRQPLGGLIHDESGALYGTTAGGGTSGRAVPVPIITIIVARPVTAMAVIAMESAPETAAHAGSTKVAVYAGTAEAATHMHPTETATASAGKFTAEATNVAAATTTGLRVGCKQAAR